MILQSERAGNESRSGRFAARAIPWGELARLSTIAVLNLPASEL